jgi:SAM-dependent methyltransferase
MLLIKKTEEIEEVLFKYHSELAIYIINKIENKSKKQIVEIGSGDGTFTIPFLEELNRDFEVFYCVDPFPGPYKNYLEILKSRIARSKCKDKIQIIKKDGSEISEFSSEIDLIIGHDVLCDLNMNKIEQIFKACFDILRPGRVFIHSGLSEIALNKSEEMLHIINRNSAQPISDATWFSPSADVLAGIAYKTGFSTIKFDYLKIPIRFEAEAAVEMVKKWNTKIEFLEKFEDDLLKFGIEYPMEQIIYLTK